MSDSGLSPPLPLYFGGKHPVWRSLPGALGASEGAPTLLCASTLQGHPPSEPCCYSSGRIGLLRAQRARAVGVHSVFRSAKIDLWTFPVVNFPPSTRRGRPLDNFINCFPFFGSATAPVSLGPLGGKAKSKRFLKIPQKGVDMPLAGWEWTGWVFAALIQTLVMEYDL